MLRGATGNFFFPSGLGSSQKPYPIALAVSEQFLKSISDLDFRLPAVRSMTSENFSSISAVGSSSDQDALEGAFHSDFHWGFRLLKNSNRSATVYS